MAKKLADPMPPADDRTLEDRLKRLEEIARMLDMGDRPLDEQLAVFAEGMALADACRAELEKAELKVEELAKSPS